MSLSPASLFHPEESSGACNDVGPCVNQGELPPKGSLRKNSRGVIEGRGEKIGAGDGDRTHDS